VFKACEEATENMVCGLPDHSVLSTARNSPAKAENP
jgi:hypothetical protein